DDIAVVEGFARTGAGLHGMEHVCEHVIVAQFIHLVAHGEEPAAVALGFLSDVALTFSCGEYFEAGTEEIIDPNSPFGAHYFIAKVHATAERPAHFKLSDGAGLVLHQRDGVVFRLNRFYLRIGPAHDLHRKDVLADIAAGDLHAM